MSDSYFPIFSEEKEVWFITTIAKGLSFLNQIIGSKEKKKEREDILLVFLSSRSYGGV